MLSATVVFVGGCGWKFTSGCGGRRWSKLCLRCGR